MKKIVLILLLSCSLININAQTTNLDDWANKYRYYRQRFNHYFISVGPNPGQSLPIVKREAGNIECRDGSAPPYALIGGSASFPDVPNSLGFYIGTLATEYYLTSQAGGDVSNIIKELYYALYAVNRLDVTDAGIGNTALDGFYIREDVPSNYVQQHPALNDNLPILGDDEITTINNVHAFSNCPGDANNSEDIYSRRGNDIQAMSMDHNCRILMGLALVKKFIPPGVTYNGLPLNSVNGNTYIQEEAIEIANRIITYMKNGHWFIWMPTANVPAMSLLLGGAPIGDWANCLVPIKASIAHTLPRPINFIPVPNGVQTPIYDFVNEPCTNCPFLSPDFLSSLAPRGCAPFEYAYGLAAAGEWITGENYIYDALDPMPLINLPFWEAAKYEVLTPDKIYDNEGNLSQVLILAAISNSWQGILPSHDTQFQIDRLDRSNQNWRLYTLLHSALHDEPTDLDFFDIRMLTRFNNAPCIGPSWSDENWFDQNMFYSKDPILSPNTSHYFKTTSTGLDYMLFYNLWYINFQSQLPPYNTNWLEFPTTTSSTISNTDINWVSPEDFPLDFSACSFCPHTDIGSNIHPTVVRALNTITASNIVHSNANVTYKAGNSITLNPGFTTEPGAVFNMLIEQTYCSGGEYLRTVASNDTASPAIYAIPMSPPTGIKNSNASSFSNNDVSTANLKKKPDSKNEMQIIPNPNTGQFYISGIEANSAIEIYNSIGELIYKSASINNPYFDLSALAKGIYFVKAQSGAEMFTDKIIIQ